MHPAKICHVKLVISIRYWSSSCSFLVSHLLSHQVSYTRDVFVNCRTLFLFDLESLYASWRFLPYRILCIDWNVMSLAPVSFCKCTCFSNSTIIPLAPASAESSSNTHGISYFFSRSISEDEVDTIDVKRDQKHRSLSCNDCNRKFCLYYDLPICKGAKEDDIFTTCFRTI